MGRACSPGANIATFINPKSMKNKAYRQGNRQLRIEHDPIATIRPNHIASS
jgi:hypothetical protein